MTEQRNPPAADRLAQTVTDAEVAAAITKYYEDYAGHRDHKLFGSPRAMREALEAFLRARESATAQEGLGFRCKQCGCVFVGRDLCNECYAAAPRAGE